MFSVGLVGLVFCLNWSSGLFGSWFGCTVALSRKGRDVWFDLDRSV